jgi:hypothetical protein
MKTTLVSRSALLFAAGLSIGAFVSASRAGIYTEAGDAGQTLATAQGTISSSSPSGSSLSMIYGTIGDSGMDADLYVINIPTATTFTASTDNTTTLTGFQTGVDGNLPLDTELFLFDGSGNAIAANDNASGSTVTSALSASLSAGIYYLGISISGNEPVNSVNQLLFATSEDSTAVRGPEEFNSLNPLTLSTFNQNNYDDETGSYRIDLTGATAVPEPSGWMLTVLGGLTVGYLCRSRRIDAA